MAYINAFTANTEVELVGHIRRNGNMWDFDVINWSDVRNSSSLARATVHTGNAHQTVAATPQTPPTPRTPQSEVFAYDTPQQSRTLSTQQSTPSNPFAGLKTSVEVMIIQAPYWVADSNRWSFFASATHDGKPRAMRICTTQMLAAFAHKMVRGSRVLLDGEVTNTRTGFVMEASNIRLSDGIICDTGAPSELPVSYSDAIAINGLIPTWHKIHADIISELTVDDTTNVYSGFTVVHNSAKTIQVHLSHVPDEGAPKLSLFTELDLIGLIKGDDDSLEMFVDWKHAAFRNDNEVAIATTKSPVLADDNLPKATSIASLTASAANSAETDKENFLNTSDSSTETVGENQLPHYPHATPKLPATGGSKPRLALHLKKVKLEQSDNKNKTRTARQRASEFSDSVEVPLNKIPLNEDVTATDGVVDANNGKDIVLGEQLLNEPAE